MKNQTGLFFFALASVLLCGATGVARAENAKGRWSFGGGFNFVSTVDDIRNNASVVRFEQPGEDGIPSTGDETILFADPRSDDLLSRETTLEEWFAFNLHASYGILDWLSLQIDVGYYEADVVQLDTFVLQPFFTPRSEGNLVFQSNDTAVFRQSQPFAGGKVTQIPLTASLIFRFRQDSPLNPYLGFGAGWVLLDSETSADLERINQTLSTQPIVTVLTNNKNFADFRVCARPDCPPFQPFDLQVEDAFQYHLVGGAELFFNSKFSIYFDARYNFLNSAIKVKSPAYQGFDQLVFNYESVNDTLPFCGDSAFDDHPFVGDPALFNRKDEGFFGLCRPGFPGDGRLQDSIIIQGGEIDLTDFTVGIGLRVYF